MKNKTFFLLLLLLITKYLHAADPKFYIMGSSNNKAASSALNYFESRFSGELTNKFPCASSLSQSDVGAMLDWERQKQLLGVGDVDQLANIAEAMKCDYLVSLRVSVLENTTIVEAFIVKKGQDKVISRLAESVPNGDETLDAIENASKRLVDDLHKFRNQLCREKIWQGTISIEQHISEELLNVDPKKPGGKSKGDISVQCVVENNVAQCTINYFDQIIGSEGNSTTVASGSDQTDVSISVFDGKTSINIGRVVAKGTSSSSFGGGSYSSDVTIPLGGWSVDAAVGTSTRPDSSSGSEKQGNLTISWSLTKK